MAHYDSSIFLVFLSTSNALSSLEEPMRSIHTRKYFLGAGALGRLYLVILPAVSPFIHAYHSTDGSSHVCRMIHLDETRFPVLAAEAKPAKNRTLPSVTLSDTINVIPLLERDAETGLVSFGPHATLRFDAWISSSSTSEPCTPSSLILKATSGGVKVRIPIPQASGWATDKWLTVDAPLPARHAIYNDYEIWNALSRVELDYECNNLGSNAFDTVIRAPTPAETMLPTLNESLIKIQLLRICKAVPGPSVCTITSTFEYKTECRDCNCQLCHKEACGCLPSSTAHCPYGTCDACPCSPLCRCCYDSACAYKCNCENCCETRSFTSCSTAITYGVDRLTPPAGTAEEGTHVILSASTSFVATPEMACRFGDERTGAVVPATLISARSLMCAVPALPGVQGRDDREDGDGGDALGSSVEVEATLDGIHWTRSNLTYHFCPPHEDLRDACLAAHGNCGPGWTGHRCDIECPGGAENACHRRGVCTPRSEGVSGMAGEKEEAVCLCARGYQGLACDVEIQTAFEGNLLPMASIQSLQGASSLESDTPDTHSHQTSARRRGVLLGAGACFLLIVIVGVGVYVKKTDVAEYIFWGLAASRFNRSRTGQEEEAFLCEGEKVSARVEGGSQVELTPSGSLVTYLPVWPCNSPQERDEEGGVDGITIM